MGTAVEIKSEKMSGNQRLYKVVPRFLGNNFIVVSQSKSPFIRKETMIFASDKNGEIDWEGIEMFPNHVDFNDALRKIGYEVVQ